ncbi:MAG: hypothetical protein AB2794_08965 [Candidatus Thiodiazotropha endolucinida]
MKITRGGVRGNNKISKLLNKPIEGKLVERKTSLLSFLVFAAAFIVLLIFAVRELELRDGIIITSIIAFFGVVAYIQAKRRVKEAKKQKWKAFEDDN